MPVAPGVPSSMRSACPTSAPVTGSWVTGFTAYRMNRTPLGGAPNRVESATYLCCVPSYTNVFPNAAGGMAPLAAADAELRLPASVMSRCAVITAARLGSAAPTSLAAETTAVASGERSNRGPMVPRLSQADWWSAELTASRSANARGASKELAGARLVARSPAHASVAATTATAADLAISEYVCITPPVGTASGAVTRVWCITRRDALLEDRAAS